MEKEDIRIGHSGDAVTLLEEMLEVCETYKEKEGQEYMDWWQVRLEALKDAIVRGIV
jgi:hypothetical protein